MRGDQPDDAFGILSRQLHTGGRAPRPHRSSHSEPSQESTRALSRNDRMLERAATGRSLRRPLFAARPYRLLALQVLCHKSVGGVGLRRAVKTNSRHRTRQVESRLDPQSGCPQSHADCHRRRIVRCTECERSASGREDYRPDSRRMSGSGDERTAVTIKSEPTRPSTVSPRRATAPPCSERDISVLL
jgi:hypothetical protein